jgi:phospholipid/cholesterol/gamma-HCH transport system permease protein
MYRHLAAMVGGRTWNALADAGTLWRLTAASSRHIVLGLIGKESLRFRAVLLQLSRAGADSLALVSLISLLIGMIVALQAAQQLSQLGAIDLVASLVAFTVIRELAPLLAAIIVAGRVGSSIAAELGTMKVSQEVDALTVMGIDPISFLVVPRLAGLLVALPCLTIFADLVGILGGLIVGVGVLGIGADRYLGSTLEALQFDDIMTGLVKATVFAAIIGLIGCQRGLQTSGGADQVGRSTTSAVVRGIFLVIAADLFITILFYIRG